MNRLEKITFAVVVAIIVALNLFTFIAAYPETYTPSQGITQSGGIRSKDFSAYYVSAWRLWNNPDQIYHFGALGGGEPLAPPYPEAYRYFPNFLLLISPFLSLNYQDALLAFDIVQFFLIPLMAYILYKILRDKPLVITLIATVIALLMPFPSRVGLFSSYYWQWGEGQAKVLLTFLLLLSFYLGMKGKPVLSGITFAFGFFDPRFGLMAVPLYIMYNRRNLGKATVSFAGSLGLSNLVLLYPGSRTDFITMVLSSAVNTELYYFTLIPLFTILCLTAINFKEIIS